MEIGGYKLVIAMVKPDRTDNAVKAAKKAGAAGATIVPATGTGLKEAKTFFGLSLEQQTDIILCLLPDCLVTPVLEAVREAGEFHKPGTGVAFVLPVEQIAGLESQMEHFRAEACKL